MSERPMSVSQAVFEVIRQAGRPLFLAQIIDHVGALPLKPTSSLRRSVQSALRRSPQILVARSGAYVLAPYLLKGALFRHVLSADDIAESRLAVGCDLRYGLVPSSFDVRGRWDGLPTQFSLENGPVLVTTVRRLDEATWGLPSYPALGEWFDAQRCRAGDHVLAEISDGEARLCHLWIVRGKNRGDDQVPDRNRSIATSVQTILAERSRPLALGRLMASLVSQGFYHDPIPPDPIEMLLTRDPRFALTGGRVSLRSGAAPAATPEAVLRAPMVAASPRTGWLGRLFHRR
jgi:hypothetical protein